MSRTLFRAWIAFDLKSTHDLNEREEFGTDASVSGSESGGIEFIPIPSIQREGPTYQLHHRYSTGRGRATPKTSRGAGRLWYGTLS